MEIINATETWLELISDVKNAITRYNAFAEEFWLDGMVYNTTAAAEYNLLEKFPKV